VLEVAYTSNASLEEELELYDILSVILQSCII